jgi:hypothetical protein
MTTTTNPPPRIAYRLANLPPLSPTSEADRADDVPSHDVAPRPPQGQPPQAEAHAPAPDAPDAHALTAELARSLQLSRASALALTRLQLAIKSGDRRQAMEALDRLHAIDADMERLTHRLPTPVEDDPDWTEWDAIERHLGDQKLALAFEKLALASAITGPDLVSARRAQDLAAFGPPAAEPDAAAEEPLLLDAPHEAPPPLSEWPRLPAAEPVGWQSTPIRILGVVAALLVMLAVATVVVTMAG